MSGGFLARWSKRKLAQALAAPAPVGAPDPAGEAAAAAGEAVAPAGEGAAPAGGGAAPAGGGAAARTPPGPAAAALPALEDLSLASDFSAFLKAEVGEALRRQALKKLFADPHFNLMDGLDIYIDDYSVPDPIPPELMDKLEHAREWLSGREGASAPEAEEEPGAPAPPTPSPPAAIAGSASDPDSAPAAAAGSDSPEPRPARRAATGEAAAPARRPVCRTGDEKGRN